MFDTLAAIIIIFHDFFESKVLDIKINFNIINLGFKIGRR